MAKVVVPAVGWEIKVGSGVDAKSVKGLNNLGFSSSDTKSDTTVAEDLRADGHERHLVMKRSKTITLAGKYLVDPDDGTRDEGQAAVEALGEEIGLDSIGDFEITNPAGKKATFKASVTMGDGGGAIDETSDWNAELTLYGKMGNFT